MFLVVIDGEPCGTIGKGGEAWVGRVKHNEVPIDLALTFDLEAWILTASWDAWEVTGVADRAAGGLVEWDGLGEWNIRLQLDPLWL